jgi:hypothetical protein
LLVLLVGYWSAAATVCCNCHCLLLLVLRLLLLLLPLLGWLAALPVV